MSLSTLLSVLCIPLLFNQPTPLHHEAFSTTNSLISRRNFQQQQQQQRIRQTFINVILNDDENEMDDVDVIGEVMEFELANHSPLGCTVEESLALGFDGKKAVFVSRVSDGGNADMAGLKVGDVITGLSGVFGELEDVSGMGIERIQTLVKGRPREEPLTIEILRGTDVSTRHEQMLMDMCDISSPYDALPDDQTIEKCVQTVVNAEYLFNDDDDDDDDEKSSPCDDTDTECLLDSMHDLWADELPEDLMMESTTMAKDGESEGRSKGAGKVAPWSSRSSPSGTYVRDPKTGIMRNIDE